MKKEKDGRASHSFTGILERSTNKLWGSHVVVPVPIAAKLTASRSRRVICRINSSRPFQCALLPFSTGVYVLSVNKKLRDQLKIAPGDAVAVRLEKDESKYGLPFPAEFSEVLAQDHKADKLFHALTPGKQRTLLYIVDSVKDPDKRIRRSIVIARHLIENGGRINYRQLATALKDPRPVLRRHAR